MHSYLLVLRGGAYFEAENDEAAREFEDAPLEENAPLRDALKDYGVEIQHSSECACGEGDDGVI